MGPGGSGQSEDNPCSSASVSLEPHTAKSSSELPAVFLTVSSCQLRGSNGPGTLGDVAIQVRKLICKWQTQQVLFKATAAAPQQYFHTSNLLEDAALEKIVFSVLWENAVPFLYRQLGCRVCLLTTYGIPSELIQGAHPPWRQTTFGGFQNQELSKWRRDSVFNLLFWVN